MREIMKMIPGVGGMIDDNPEMERFMGLTETGKADALALGESLPGGPAYRLFASSIGRCIETA